MCFPVNFAKLLRTAYFREHIPWLLLERLNVLDVILETIQETIKHFSIYLQNFNHPLTFLKQLPEVVKKLILGIPPKANVFKESIPTDTVAL